MARVYPLFSGSSGNSYFLGSKEAGILLDAGKNAKQIGLMLEKCGISPNAVKGIVISHEHVDHVSALRVFASKYNIPAFCSEKTRTELVKNGVANGKFPIHIIENGLQLADMEINHFKTPHDSAESIGFRVKMPDEKIFSLATDLGYITDEVKQGLEGSDFCVIESNHEIEMLQSNLCYPYNLKKRILSNFGHLSNKDCAEYLPNLHKTGVKRFLLAHLSSENNYPSLALETSICSMTMAGFVRDVDYTIEVARRENQEGKGIIF